jgi:hypothetical protein
MRTISIIAPLLFVVSFAGIAAAQAEQAARVITSQNFESKRPAAKAAAGTERAQTADAAAGPKKSSAVLSSPKRKYSFVSRSVAMRPVVPRSSAAAAAPIKAEPAIKKPQLKTEELGVTFWRLRPLTPSDGDVPSFPVKVDDGIEKWAAERVRSSTKFKQGDRVRFTIESSRSGYLYIANREVYADGSTGDAEIIFPTLRTRSGDNRVSAGTLIEIPGSGDSVPYFTVQPRRADYAGEELIVLITSTEIPDIEKSLRAQPISREQLEKWYQWQMGADVYDADDGEGIAFTKVEADAVQSASRSLTREEPLPQTIYRVQTPKDSPLFVIIRMETER